MSRGGFGVWVHQQEGVADVLVGRAAVQRHLHVHDARDGVDKFHHVLLQHLGRVGELPHVAEAEDGRHLRARRRCQVAGYAPVGCGLVMHGHGCFAGRWTQGLRAARLLPWDHRVEVAAILDVLSNHLRTASLVIKHCELADNRSGFTAELCSPAICWPLQTECSPLPDAHKHAL